MMGTKKHNSEYRTALVAQLWQYRRIAFGEGQHPFDRSFDPDARPPVFHRDTSDLNILTRPGLTNAEKDQLLSLIPRTKRHRWFRSMSSSQALAQSVLGNLIAVGKQHLLWQVRDDDEDLPLFRDQLDWDAMVLEHDVTQLCEPVRTSLDAFLPGDYQIAVECKLTEPEIGTCSRPRLRPSAKDYDARVCNGSYKFRRDRRSRCALLCQHPRIRYWELLPQLFPGWRADIDHDPCPLRDNYQLVRNVLAACVRDDGKVATNEGHAVLLYDARNPAFQQGGKADCSFRETRNALISPGLLRRASWQAVSMAIAQHTDMEWLIEALEAKYGLRPSTDGSC